MEIERKYLIDRLPENIEQYECKHIEQGYLNTDPVVRIRKSNDKYTLTYKGAGLMCREEYNLPLNAEAFARGRAAQTDHCTVRLCHFPEKFFTPHRPVGTIFPGGTMLRKPALAECTASDRKTGA